MTQIKSYYQRGFLFFIVMILLGGFLPCSSQTVSSTIQISSDSSEPNDTNSDLGLLDFNSYHTSEITLGKVNYWLEVFETDDQAITIDSQDNCYFAGSVKTETLMESDIIFGKLDANGTIAWVHSFNIATYDQPKDIIYDEEYDQVIIVGETQNSSDTNMEELFILSVESVSGFTNWLSLYNVVSRGEKAQSVAIGSSRIFIAGTQFDYIGGSDSDVFLGSFYLHNGSLDWITFYDTSYNHNNARVIYSQSSNSLFFLYAQYRYVSSEDDYKFFMREVLINGTTLWEIEAGDEENVHLIAARLSPEGNGIVVAGEIESSSNGLRAIEFLFFNLDGLLINQFTLGDFSNDERISDFAFDSENNIFIVGTWKDCASCSTEALYYQCNYTGHPILQQHVDSYEKSWITDIVVDSQDNVILVGFLRRKSDFIIDRMFLAITKDSDQDGLSDTWEYKIGTDPFNPDSDGDGWSDGIEYQYQTDPLNKFSNPSLREFIKTFFLWFFVFFVIVLAIMGFLLSASNVRRMEETSDTPKQSFIFRLYLRIERSFRNLKKKYRKSEKES